MRAEPLADGIHSMVPRERMSESARKTRDTYAITPGAPLFKKEFGYYCLDRWREQGMPQDVPLEELFDYDPPGIHYLGELGWTTAAFSPAFEERIVEDRGEYELVQDTAGRHVLFFKGRRNGFMPEYVSHPVKDQRSWEDNAKCRLDPSSPARYEDLGKRMAEAKEDAGKGLMVSQRVIGGCMYLRSLMGPLEFLYALNDQPALIHDCMSTWLALADRVTSIHQQHVSFDELFLAEDICYKHGPLLSPDMIREFLVPYYQQLLTNVRARQIDRTRHLYVQIDTDGFAEPLIPLYRKSIGMDAMSPFEVAAGCDVVRVGRNYPDLVISGGVDKRVLAQGRDAIDRFLERVVVPMRARGGYTPTSDHGVPEEVPYEDYLYYRKRIVEIGG